MTTQPPADTDALIEEARERLSAWLDDVQLSNQLGCPHYANPGELKRDLRVLLDALARERKALDEEIERATENGRLARKHWDRAERAEAQTEALEAFLRKLGYDDPDFEDILASLPPPQEEPADPTAVDHGIDGSGDTALQ